MILTDSTPKRIDGIDGLRAIAVIAVVLYHLNHVFMPGGFVGVDVFFVISGYVVCRSLLKDDKSNFTSFISAFYVRRLLRIYPVLILTILIGSVLSAVLIPPSYLSSGNSGTGSWAILGLSNIALVVCHNDYFAKTNDFNPYSHTWSLGVEEQFYLIFPLILFFITRTTKTGTLARLATRAVLPALVAVSFVVCVFETLQHPDRAYFLLQSRFWELGIGALICLANREARWTPANPRQSRLLITVGTALLLLSVFVANSSYFPFPFAIPPVLGTSLCILGLVSPFATGVGIKFLSHPVLVLIGRMSYSIYLWHWPIIVIMRWTVGMDTTISIVSAFVLTMFLSAASYLWIERPLQRPNQFLASRKLTTLLAGASFILFAFYINKKIGGPTVRYIICLSTVSRNRSDWYPAYENVDEPGPLHTGTNGMRWSNRRIFAVGDSHAYAYGGLLRMLKERDGVSVLVDSAPANPYGSLVYPGGAGGNLRKNEILKMLETYSRPGDVVFLAHLRFPRFCEQWEKVSPQLLAERIQSENEDSREIALKEGRELVAIMTQLGLNVIVAAPLPAFKSPPFRGSDWFNQMNPDVREGYTISSDLIIEHRKRAMNSINQLASDIPGIHPWDPLPQFFHGDKISAFDGKKPMFFDGDHLSDYGGRMLYPSLKATLEKIWD